MEEVRNRKIKKLNSTHWNFIIIALLLVIALVAYILIWESRQPKFELKGVTVLKLLPYHRTGGDLHWSFKGYRIYIEGDERPIDFPIRNWDDSIRVNDVVNLVVRRSFFNDELDGLYIERVK